MPLQSTVATPSGAMTRAVWSTAVLVESDRRLPETSSSCSAPVHAAKLTVLPDETS